MKTLALLAALLLLALHGQAGPLAETADQVPHEPLGVTAEQGTELPGVYSHPEDEHEAEDQDVVLFFDEHFAQAIAGVNASFSCSCRLGGCQCCESPFGHCQRHLDEVFALCCSSTCDENC